MSVDVVPTVVYSSMLGMTLLALLENTSRRGQSQTTFLSGIFALLTVHILGELYIHSGFFRFAPSLAGLEFPVRVLLGPALYFYAVATMSPDSKLPAKSYWWAMSGPVLVIVIMMPFLFGITSEQKLALADPQTRDPELWRIAITTCLLSMLVFVVFTWGYLFATLKLHAKHRQQLLDRYSSIETRSMDWFKRLLYCWGFAWLLFAAEFTLGFLGIRWFGSGIILPITEALVLLIFAHLALKQPILKSAEKGSQRVAYRVSTLSLSRMQEIADSLIASMESDKLFMEDDLSLKRLSEVTNITENHISETLSQHLNTNFFKFVNAYRVKVAQTLLLTTDKQITTIAYEVGFNSKSTFNNAFKQQVGSTPTGFRNQKAA